MTIVFRNRSQLGSNVEANPLASLIRKHTGKKNFLPECSGVQCPGSLKNTLSIFLVKIFKSSLSTFINLDPPAESILNSIYTSAWMFLLIALSGYRKFL